MCGYFIQTYIVLMIMRRIKKLYCVIFKKYKIFQKRKILYIFKKTLFLSINCSKCKNEDEKVFKEETVKT